MATTFTFGGHGVRVIQPGFQFTPEGGVTLIAAVTGDTGGTGGTGGTTDTVYGDTIQPDGTTTILNDTIAVAAGESVTPVEDVTTLETYTTDLGQFAVTSTTIKTASADMYYNIDIDQDGISDSIMIPDVVTPEYITSNAGPEGTTINGFFSGGIGKPLIAIGPDVILGVKDVTPAGAKITDMNGNPITSEVTVTTDMIMNASEIDSYVPEPTPGHVVISWNDTDGYSEYTYRYNEVAYLQKDYEKYELLEPNVLTVVGPDNPDVVTQFQTGTATGSTIGDMLVYFDEANINSYGIWQWNGTGWDDKLTDSTGVWEYIGAGWSVDWNIMVDNVWSESSYWTQFNLTFNSNGNGGVYPQDASVMDGIPGLIEILFDSNITVEQMIQQLTTARDNQDTVGKWDFFIVQAG